MASPRFNELGLWPLSNDTLPAIMSLQKEAFHLVVAFLEEGVEAGWGGLVDIAATLGTAKLQDRRVILQQIGRKYKAVLARQMVEHISITEWSMYAVSGVKRLELLVRAEQLQWGYDPYTELFKALREENDFAERAALKVAEHSRWFGQELIPDGGTHGSLDEFCNRVLAPTFVKWMLL